MNFVVLLKNLTHLRFKGPDAERYLNGQVTQQVEGLEQGHSRYTFVCDAKGRILFDATIFRDSEGFLLSVDGGERDEILARMDRYLIADDCELSDESDRWVIYHRLQDNGTEEGLVNRFGTPGLDCYQEASKPLADHTADNSSPQLAALRIDKEVPRFPDLVGALSAETGLEYIAVSFNKGCYLGQEVISRMKRAGKTNRQLVKVQLTDIPTELPAPFTSQESEKILLEVTSVSETRSEGCYPALGYLKSKYSGETLLNLNPKPIFAQLPLKANS